MNLARLPNELLQQALVRTAHAYFEQAEEIFAAAQAGGEETFCFDIAGVKICLRVAGRKLGSVLTGPFRHLEETSTREPDLTILCWDNTAAERKLPTPHGLFRQIIGSHENQRRDQSPVRISFHDWMHLLSGLDLERKRAFYFIEDLAAWPHCEQAMPMKHLLNPLFNLHGKQLMHAAAVGTAAGSLLLTAPGGRGKSTTALTALQHGLLYASDDVCLVTGGEVPRSYSLYNTAKLRRDGVERFPDLKPLLTFFREFGEEKAYFNVHRSYPERILCSAPIRAILQPSITGEEQSRLEPANRLEAMRDSLPSTLQLVPQTDATGQHILTHLYARLPVYQLLLGRDPKQLADLLRGLLA